MPQFMGSRGKAPGQGFESPGDDDILNVYIRMNF